MLEDWHHDRPIKYKLFAYLFITAFKFHRSSWPEAVNKVHVYKSKSGVIYIINRLLFANEGMHERVLHTGARGRT